MFPVNFGIIGKSEYDKSTFMAIFPKLVRSSLIIVLAIFAYKAYAFFSKEDAVLDYSKGEKNILVKDNGLEFSVKTKAETVQVFLEEENIKILEYDRVRPEKEVKIYPGTSIEIKRAVSIAIKVDGREIENYTLAENIGGVLSENGVVLGRLDEVSPDKLSPPRKDAKIIVTRINIEEVVKKEDIDFEIITKNDSKLGWREKKIETPGEKGVREVKYKITYKDGREISRVILEKNILEEPLTQVEIQGTYMKLGKANKGQATWYAYQGGMFAASLSIPEGGYAKVTNTANGKSIVVQINDSGPYGKGRIIDLDKVAFQKIASLGAGVIGVKVEEVLN